MRVAGRKKPEIVWKGEKFICVQGSEKNRLGLSYNYIKQSKRRIDVIPGADQLQCLTLSGVAALSEEIRHRSDPPGRGTIWYLEKKLLCITA